MAEQYYQSVFSGAQIDNGIGRIISGELDRLAEDAKTSATNAAISETNAKTSETNAKNSETNAANSEGAALAAQKAAEKARDEAQDISGGNFLPLSGGTMAGELVPNGGIAHVGKDGYIAYPDGGYLNADYEGTTGALKITLPANGDTNSMIRFTVKLYSYYYVSVCDYVIGGFLSSGWQQTAAFCAAPKNRNLTNLPVQFCKDGNKRYVLIGNTSTNWMYSKIAVTDVVLGGGVSDYENWKSGWKVEIVNETAPAGSITFENTNFANGLTAADVGADASGTAASEVGAHNNNPSAHADIRAGISNAVDVANSASANASYGIDVANSASANASYAISVAEGKAPMYQYSTTDLTAGSSSLTTGTLYFVYE